MKNIIAYIDRIEDDKAVIRFKEYKGEIVITVKDFTTSIKQGQVINFDLSIDETKTKELENEIKDILEEI